MLNFHFRLKDQKAKTKTRIYLVLNYSIAGEKKRIKVSTGRSVPPINWSTKRECLKTSAAGNLEFNKFLKSFREDAEKVFNDLDSKGTTPTPEQFITAFEDERNPYNKPQQKTFWQIYEEYEQRAKKRLEWNSYKNIRATYRKVKEFENFWGQRLTFELIDEKFKTAFVDFLEYELDYAINTAGGHLHKFKMFMNDAYKKGYHQNLRFKDFKEPKEELDPIFLSEDELVKIYNLDLSNNPRLDRVRDWLIIGCNTGFRYSDIQTLRPEHIIENRSIIQKKMVKVKNTVYVPIQPVVKEILKKYNWEFPPVIKEQKFNEYVKEVCELAGINKMVIPGDRRGNVEVNDAGFAEKFKCISSHTMRRTLCNNLYLAGWELEDIMTISGHRTKKALMSYLRIEKLRKAKRLVEKMANDYQGGRKIIPLRPTGTQ